MSRDELVARLVRAGELEVSGADQAEVDTYFADTPPAAYYTIQHPDQFDLAPIPPLAPAVVGISVPKDKTALHDAVRTALLSMVADGSYVAILTKYHVQDGALTPTDINK